MKKLIKSLIYSISPKYQTLHLEYKVNFMPRYSNMNGHPKLYEIINEYRDEYEILLEYFNSFKNNFATINDSAVKVDEKNPTWNNGFLPGMDIIGIFGILAKYKPKHYIEIGSGNSTKVAKKSIIENSLNTKIISIDPFPRASIDMVANEVIRRPLENLENLSFIIDTLDKNDVLFIDNSHRVLPNSDALVCFLEILPYLKKGVVVHIHDVYLPYDYPQFMCDRFYSEQYMLAAYLLANPNKFKVILPNFFISKDEKLNKVLNPIWELVPVSVERHGGSFWFEIN